MQRIVRYFDVPRPMVGRNLLILLAGLALGIVIVSAFTGGPARAADKGRVTIKDAAAAAPETPWSGCAIGAYGGLMQGSVSLGGPIDIGSEGTVMAPVASCDYQSGKAVIGVFASYGWAGGDLEKIGLNTDLSIGGRVGYLIWPSALLYGSASWSRLDTDGGNLNGYKLGMGVELKLPDAPIFIDLRYERGRYDDVFGSSLDIDSNIFRAGASYKFNFAR